MDKIIKTYGKLAHLRPAGFWPGFIVGLVYFSYIFWWTWSMYPLESLGLNGFSSFAVLFYFFVVTIFGLSSVWGLFSYYIFRVIHSQVKIHLLPFFASGGFVVAEYLRSWVYGIIWFSNNGSLGPHWTLGNPAYLFSDFYPLAVTASFWGIYGVDFIVIFFITSLVLLILLRPLKILLICWVLSSLLLVWLLNVAKRPNNASYQPLPIALIQTQFSTTLNKSGQEIISDFNKKIDLLKNSARETGGGIIVLPEGNDFSNTLTRFLDSNSIENFFNNLSPNETIIVDHAKLRGPNDTIKSTSLFINSKNGLAGSSDKKVLTPAGEYLPFLMKWLPALMGAKSEQSYISSREFSKGTNFESLFFKNLNIKTVVCSEIFSPNLLRGNYGLIIGQSSLGIFRGNELMERELVSALKLRAIENNKPAVLASNYGRSYVINSSGKIEKMTDSLGYQMLTTAIVPNKELTWYNKLGDLPILLLSLAILGLSLINLRYAKQD